MGNENSNIEKWFVAKTIYMSEALQEDIHALPVEVYMPKLRADSRKLMTFNYVFLHGVEQEVVNAVRMVPKMHLMYRHKDNTADIQAGRSLVRDYITVGDRAMTMFMKTVSMYQKGAVVENVDQVTLSKGDRVLITAGPFEGVEGVLLTTKGRDGGKVVVSIEGLISVSTLDIEPKDIKVLEFASGNKHIYKKMDSFQPFVLEVYSRLRQGVQPTDDECHRMSLFVQRFAEAKTDTVNMESRLKTLSFVAYACLGIDDYATALYKYLKRELLPTIKAARAKAFLEEQLENYEQLRNVSFSQHD